MRLAALSDIHGNLPALEAVLAEAGPAVLGASSSGAAGGRLRLRGGGEHHGGDRRDLLRGGVPAHELQHGSLLLVLPGAQGARLLGAHSGMFPCFFAGVEARLSRRPRRPRTMFSRVSDGAITAST